MKKKLIALIVILSSVTIFSQNRGKYFDAPFGGGGGFTPGWIFPNFDQLNPMLQQFGVPEFSNGGFFTTGGGGFIYVGFIKNLRIGGMGFGGSISTSSSKEQIIIDKISKIKSPQLIINKEVEYSLGGGGLTIEYTLPFVKNFGISVGAIIGGGSLTIDIYKNQGEFNWNQLWQEVSNFTSENAHRTIKNNFWFFTPTLNFDIPVYRFVALRFGGGYQITFANNWEADNNKELSNVPSDLNGNAFFIQAGVLVGFFGF